MDKYLAGVRVWELGLIKNIEKNGFFLQIIIFPKEIKFFIEMSYFCLGMVAPCPFPTSFYTCVNLIQFNGNSLIESSFYNNKSQVPHFNVSLKWKSKWSEWSLWRDNCVDVIQVYRFPFHRTVLCTNSHFKIITYCNDAFSEQKSCCKQQWLK